VNEHYFDRLMRTLSVATSRRHVLGALLTATFVPRLPAVRGAATPGERCPCPEPPCFLRTWGREGSDPAEFDEPAAIAVAPDGTVYVTDYGDHCIQSFDATGTFLSQWGGEGYDDGLFDPPSDVAVAPDGTGYVAEQHNHRIQYFDATGGFLGKWTGGFYDSPTAVAVAPDRTVYVADYSNHWIQYFDATGTALGQWGSKGTGDGQFSFPSDVAVAPDSTLVYVTDYGDHRIQAFCVTA
jgi:tripartite motif-containing protein 71